MSHYLSNLLTQTTSRYNTLRRTLLPTEDDGDTDDDSHISRVLRAYYTEKARPFPPWLPPDPNDRRALTPQPQYHQQQGGSGYFAGGSGQQGGVGRVQAQHQAGNRGSLSDLWDPAPAQPQQQNLQPQSLRAGRRSNTPSASTLAVPAPQGPRLLPSQRAGSYQNQNPNQQHLQAARPALEPSPPSSSGGGTAQERLKARLWGGARGGSSTSVNTLGSMNANAGLDGAGGGAYDGGRYGR